jgi:hypothetical protein
VELQYIKDLSEAYVIDNELFKEKLTANELAENFHNLLIDLRANQPFLYEQINSSNKFYQQKIFKTYFDLTFKEDQIFAEIQEEELDNLEDLNEFVEISLWNLSGFILTFLILAWKRQKISKNIYKTIIFITNTINKIGKNLVKWGRDTKMAYAIIQTNAKKCYDDCKFNPDEASIEDYMYQARQGSTTRDVGRIFQSEASEEKLDCLRKCYLYSIRETVKLLAHSYFTCLKSTGDLSKLPLEKDFTAYQLVLSKSGLSESCDTISASYQEAFGNFAEVLSLLYYEKLLEIRKLKAELMAEIYNIQKDFSGGNFQVRTHPKPQFTPGQQKPTGFKRPTY